jgi:molecular chaperone GrpE (heat shock protein)
MNRFIFYLCDDIITLSIAGIAVEHPMLIFLLALLGLVFVEVLLYLFAKMGFKWFGYTLKAYIFTGKIARTAHQNPSDIVKEYFSVLDAQNIGEMLIRLHNTSIAEINTNNKDVIEEIKQVNNHYITNTAKMKSAIISIRDATKDNKEQIKNWQSVLQELHLQYDSLARMLHEKNDEIARYQKGYNATVIQSMLDKLILFIHGLQLNKNVSSELKETLIQSIEQILEEYHVYRIGAEVGEQLDPKTMRILGTHKTIEREKDNTVRSVSTYGYQIKEEGHSRILTTASVYTYRCVNHEEGNT